VSGCVYLIGARMPSRDLEDVPGLVCGQTYRDQRAEAAVPAWRAGEVTPWTGCGTPIAWVHAYRCRQCGRWLHGHCFDRHVSEQRPPASDALP
jgi:hypothetical protein